MVLELYHWSLAFFLPKTASSAASFFRRSTSLPSFWRWGKGGVFSFFYEKWSVILSWTKISKNCMSETWKILVRLVVPSSFSGHEDCIFEPEQRLVPDCLFTFWVRFSNHVPFWESVRRSYPDNKLNYNLPRTPLFLFPESLLLTLNGFWFGRVHQSYNE